MCRLAILNTKKAFSFIRFLDDIKYHPVSEIKKSQGNSKNGVNDERKAVMVEISNRMFF